MTQDIVDKNLHIFQRPRAVFQSAFGSGTGNPSCVVRGLGGGHADMGESRRLRGYSEKCLSGERSSGLLI